MNHSVFTTRAYENSTKNKRSILPKMYQFSKIASNPDCWFLREF
ncbi:hypothetical protein LEP1GSC074_2194 [Leptospira noguchii str. Hook]|uniref:Uncharacterized protein n=2 Tax=Leptospira noguchii TaxID=28182 RepID=M6UJK0_9LEPT|nr:hypothetical protein LEP1GSC041_2664 [Leptospira noguchii str. 2006001870]EMN02479.1 hypothetical protein LEP1GSC035_2458 [Leptospira noguchii str. 2007001578]EMO27862.1 hypothetical protein LEP1GSC170_2078 [Leptospira interrogans serovar Bataviae str. HAI135]EMO41249.1 hypothetical protein LEP1GSC186_3053 [Leptospira noguchii serovar Autumnalis str. ZUN142]EMS88416.1 hypothetical protein LEP1GSC074_2194 [Leptospira noguchii str. Hook]